MRRWIATASPTSSMSWASGTVSPYSREHPLNDGDLAPIEARAEGRDHSLDVHPISVGARLISGTALIAIPHKRGIGIAFRRSPNQ